MHIPIARRSERVPAPSPPCLPNDFHRQRCTGNATCFLECPRVCKLWEYAGQALRVYCAAEKILLITCLKSKAVRLLFYKAGERGRWGWWEEEEGEEKKKRGGLKKRERVKGKREKERERKGCISKFLQQLDGEGGSWAQCEIIEVKGGSPSLVRKWWIRTVYQTIIFFWNWEAAAGTILQMCLMSSGQKWAASSPPPPFKVSHQGLLLPPLLPGPSPPFFSGQLRPPPTDRLCIPGLWTHWQGPLWDPNQDPHVTGT